MPETPARGGYDRYGLTGNPFRELSSESLENVDIFHINQDIDGDITTIKAEVAEKENKAFVAVLGGLGAGKTERLILAASEASATKAFHVYCDLAAGTHEPVKGILAAVLDEARKRKLKGFFSTPPWYSAAEKALKALSKRVDPVSCGNAIAAAFNANRPSYLLLNDLHNVAAGEEMESFLQVLHVLADATEKGVMIMASADREQFGALMEAHESVSQRINRRFVVPPLSDPEAALVIAKRLVAKRIVDDLPPLYPFSEESIHSLNADACGNPRRLLMLADAAIEYASRARSMQIDADTVAFVLQRGKNRQLPIEFEKKGQIEAVAEAVAVEASEALPPPDMPPGPRRKKVVSPKLMNEVGAPK
jgi:type II secretory pathway predicted ATPase ExeA